MYIHKSQLHNLEGPAAASINNCPMPDGLFAAGETELTFSIAISLKRIADVLEQFGDHPDNRNDYGEFGMKAVQGTLERTASAIINDISITLHNLKGR